MKNSYGEQSIKTLNKRKIGNANTLNPSKNLKNIIVQQENQTLNNSSNRYKLFKLQDQKTQDVSSFNKELLKNKKKKYQSSQNEIKPINKQESTSVIPSIRKTQTIGYRNIKLLRSFLTDYKKIKPRRLTKLTLKQQRQLSKSVKRARTLKLFDPRKTLKPKKFLNLERKNEIVNILLTLQILKLNKFIKIIKDIDIKNLIKVTQSLKIINDYESETLQSIA